jgi:hypothetical protein
LHAGHQTCSIRYIPSQKVERKPDHASAHQQVPDKIEGNKDGLKEFTEKAILKKHLNYNKIAIGG